MLKEKLSKEVLNKFKAKTYHIDVEYSEQLITDIEIALILQGVNPPCPTILDTVPAKVLVDKEEIWDVLNW